MLRIRQSKSAEQAKRYARESLTKGDYYCEGQEMAGLWGGKGAARLGLVGRVEKAAYDALCDNLNPFTGEKLTLRNKSDRRPGWDFNFNPPKSVSLAYAWTKDERIVQVHRKAVLGAMLEAQERAATRVRVDGQNEVRLTKELAWAEFLHFTARPENGFPDPHLHSHIYVFNFTFDPKEKRLKAVELGDVKANGAYYQAVYLSLLETGLRELGLEIVRTGKFFEIAGVSRSLNEKFSRRGKAVNVLAEKLGITDPREKDKLAALTREKKIKGLPISELEPIWWERLTAEDKIELEGLAACLKCSQTREPVAPEKSSAALRQSKRGLAQEIPPVAGRGGSADRLGASGVPLATQADKEAVEFAVKHLFYTRSVATERELIAEALNWGYGKATLPGIKAAVKGFPLRRFARGNDILITTAEVILEESRIISRCKGGHDQSPPLNPAWCIQDSRLNDQQREAVFHILHSREFITGVVGKAGVGKTTTLLEAAKGIEAGGGKVMAFAPTASASRGTLRESGFPEAETISNLLAKPSLQEQARGKVWFVDEGGLMSTRATDKLLALAERLDARVVLVGDPRQIHSVERGDAFRLLQEQGEMSVVTIDIIQRQSGLYREGVRQISQGRYVEAFETFERMQSIYEIEDAQERYKALAARYVEAVNAGKSVLLVAPTHAECDAVTQEVRELLMAKGQIGEARKWNILRNLAWTPAQRAYALSYKPGLVVKVTGHMKGFALGDEFEVVEARKGGVFVRRQDGEARALPLAQPEHFSVYERDSIEVGKGETIRITVNTYTADGHRLNNGDVHSVKQFSRSGEMILENNWRLRPDFRFLDWGYTQTAYSAQSRTVEVVLVAQSGTLSMGAGDADQFYSTIARGSKELGIYTDSLDGLRENVAWVRKRELATEVINRAVCDEERELERQQSGDELTWAVEAALSARLGKEKQLAPEIGVEITAQKGEQEFKPPECEREAEMEICK